MAAWEAALVEHAEVSGQWFEPGCVAGGGDEDVCLDSRSAGEDEAGLVERFDAGGDLDPAGPDRLDDLLVDDRGCLALAPEPGEDSLGRWGETVLAEVADGQPARRSAWVSAIRGGKRSSAVAGRSPGSPPDWRSMIFGWVRMQTRTRSAPPSARS